MNCPACTRPLREKSAGEFTVDICHGGCGGIWFDASELQRVGERAAAALHRVWQPHSRPLKFAAKRLCPRCPEQVLDCKWFSDSKTVEIDQCPKCGGIWLDDGEFSRIYEEILRGAPGSPPWAAALAEAVTSVQADPGARRAPPRT